MSPSYTELSVVSDRLQDFRKEDRFEITGENVASKLRMLSKEQGIIVGRIIRDVLYEAELGTLTRHSKVIVNDS